MRIIYPWWIGRKDTSTPNKASGNYSPHAFILRRSVSDVIDFFIGIFIVPFKFDLVPFL